MRLPPLSYALVSPVLGVTHRVAEAVTIGLRRVEACAAEEPLPPSPERLGHLASLLGQLVWIGKHDLRLPAVIADLSCHTNALAAERGLGGAEFGTIVSVYNRGEDRMRIRFSEIQ